MQRCSTLWQVEWIFICSGPGGVFLPGTTASGLVIRQDLIDEGAYRDPADFRGRGLAVSSVQSQFYAVQILAQAGLSASDVNFTTIGLPQMLAALQGHAVDAAWLVEPLISASVAVLARARRARRIDISSR